jgi:hypothetical protein
MSDMSPLARLILRTMRVGAVGAAGFVVLVIGIEAAKRWAAGGIGAVSRADAMFFAVLAVLLFGALYLARSITRELRDSGP